ncbi:MAG TPA: ATP-binding protein [Thermomicrobiales bacterium]|nr:ATP-binding protein [Thermomicrobiales bacterium]
MTEANRGKRLGVVTEGSFSAGLTVRLDSPSSEALQVGSFVVIEGDENRYFSLVTDLQLRATDPGVLSDPPTGSAFVRQALHGIHSYAVAVVRPSLMLPNPDDLLDDSSLRAVRTIPAHYSELRTAEKVDFDYVFGRESQEHFALGSPVAMDDVMIPINLPKLIERSNGIFGQTGTGKSVLARLILFGLIRSRLASTLIFDMHDEYAEGDPKKPEIPGLRTLFGPTGIKVFDLDDRANSTNPQIKIGLNQIEPGDIALLADELDLRDTFDATSFALHRAFGSNWLAQLLDEDNDPGELAERIGAHQGALEGLIRKLRYLVSRPYIVRHSSDDPVRSILEHLLSGRHVIVQFGRQSALRDYMLVANILTRRIHDRYTERAGGVTNGKSEAPPPLVVVLEEAHKFLNPAAARQSIFGTIAREMRKFGVSLLVIDQRPSGVDSEILSQLGTRITGLLTDPADIDAVLSGTGDRAALRAMLASLEPTRQCMVVGHAVPMPIILATRKYGPELKELLVEREQLGAELGALLSNPRKVFSGDA